MKKQELLKRISERTQSGLSKEQVNEVLDAFTNEVLNLLTPNDTEADKISLPMLGTFSVKEKKARKGVNPSTGEKIDIAGYRTIAFKAVPSVKKL